MIHLNQDHDIWTVTLSRPEKANSLTSDMLTRLVEIATEAQRARGFILTGEGRVFSAGADLDQAKAGLATSPLWDELSSAIARLPCLTVAALNGTLAGGATGMALACDLRLCVPQAKFFYPVMKLGYLPQPADPERLRALVGPARTKLILMCGDKISAQEALNFGLVDKITEPEALMQTAFDLCAPSAEADKDLAAQIKQMCSAPKSG